MAAFCTCCGAVIKAKSEKCLVCGAPRHGMTGAASTLTPSEERAVPNKIVEDPRSAE